MSDTRPRPVLLWFRRDLRLDDNPALLAAAATDRPVLPVFIHDPAEFPGEATRWWLHHSLAALTASLAGRGLPLVLRRGPAAATLVQLSRETGAGLVLAGRVPEPVQRALEEEVAASLGEQGVELRLLDSALLGVPGQLQTGQGGPYQVFTPFHKAFTQRVRISEPRDAPDRLSAWPVRVPGEELASWELLPRISWDSGLGDSWSPGEEGAQQLWRRFRGSGLAHYGDQRDFPAVDGTSRLAPHLHFGEISARRLWFDCLEANGAGVAEFARQLVWRDFAHELLNHFPHTTQQPLREKFAHFPWDGDPALLPAWQQGRTGYPLVDAGMRQLWHTGWMHNRVRMVVASFLVKHLLLPWQEGADWFMDTLVDADLANNTFGWQWAAGCGADAAPYFRIFNPTAQARKFDKQGRYIRRWVPELASLPDRHLHQPWEAPSAVLAAAGLRLGRDYPRPVVDHAWARARALESLRKMGTS